MVIRYSTNGKNVTSWYVSPVERFHKSYEVADNGCWMWTKETNARDYGRLILAYAKYTDYVITTKREIQSAHRFSYELYKGAIPDGLHVCHSCDTPRCVNPDHLWVGTNSDNMQDAIKKGRQTFPSGEGAKAAKLDWATVHAIRYLKAIRVRNTFQAKHWGLTKGYISNIIHHRYWRTEDVL